MKNNVKTILVLIILLLGPFISGAEENNLIKTVIVEGLGNDIQSASQNAAQNALISVIGSFIDSSKFLEKKVQIEDGIRKQSVKIDSNIREYSQGSITHFEIVESKQDNSFIKIKASVSVRLDDMKAFVAKFAATDKPVEQGLFTIVDAEKNQAENLRGLLHDLFDPFVTGQAFEIQISKLKPATQITPLSGYRENITQDQRLTFLSQIYPSDELVFFDLSLAPTPEYKEKFFKVLDSVSIKKFNIPQSSQTPSFQFTTWVQEFNDRPNSQFIEIINNGKLIVYELKLNRLDFSKNFPYIEYSNREFNKIFTPSGKITNLQIMFEDSNKKVLYKNSIDKIGAQLYHSPVKQTYHFIPLTVSGSDPPIFDFDQRVLRVIFPLTSEIRQSSNVKVSYFLQ